MPNGENENIFVDYNVVSKKEYTYKLVVVDENLNESPPVYLKAVYKDIYPPNTIKNMSQN